MKIDVITIKPHRLKDINFGGVFSHNGTVYMKMFSTLEVETGLCVELATGNKVFFLPTDVIKPHPNARLIFE